MDRLHIRGQRPLYGEIPISGAKNAALPLMAAALLADSPLILENVPDLADIRTMAVLLHELGLEVRREAGGRLVLSGAPRQVLAPYDIVRRMRASVLVLGPLLARLGAARRLRDRHSPGRSPPQRARRTRRRDPARGRLHHREL
jgi:UDP-N-acetylglucosamine 1-carboxyvinyltransferase